jgi:hypothetical protein
MSNTDKVFAGSIPKLYDEYLVPLIFAVYAGDIARRVAAPLPPCCSRSRRAPAP